MASDTKITLIHGLFAAGDEQARHRRAQAFAKYGEALGVRHYEWVEGRDKKLGNRLLRLLRGTARAIEAVEVIELDEAAVRATLEKQSTRTRWQHMAGCDSYGLDPARAFILAGAPRLLLDGSPDGMRVLWFGRGLSHLSEAEFIAHYTGNHGPLVAGNATLLGMRRYQQVPNEQHGLCATLRELGMGQSGPPAVFAELISGKPPFNLASLRARRAALREIGLDEKRHIDFGCSMLLLA